jgi:hypothetical protein
VFWDLWIEFYCTRERVDVETADRTRLNGVVGNADTVIPCRCKGFCGKCVQNYTVHVFVVLWELLTVLYCAVLKGVVGTSDRIIPCTNKVCCGNCSRNYSVGRIGCCRKCRQNYTVQS